MLITPYINKLKFQLENATKEERKSKHSRIEIDSVSFKNLRNEKRYGIWHANGIRTITYAVSCHNNAQDTLHKLNAWITE